MKLTFTWDKAGSIPLCESDSKISQGVSPLACLLMDDGGIDVAHSRQWLNVGLERADEAIAGLATKSEWSREVWGAKLSKQTTEVYSLLDEQWAETMPTIAFRKALFSWLNFIERPSSRPLVVTLGTPKKTLRSKFKR